MHLTTDYENIWIEGRNTHFYITGFPTIVAGNCNTPLTIMDRTTRHKINKETEDFNHTINKLDLTDIDRALWPTSKYTFSGAHETISREDHILDHKLMLLIN